MQRNQHRFLFGFLAAVVLVGGCQGPTSVDSSASRASTDVPAEDDLSNLDLGGDWSDFEQQLATRNVSGASGSDSRGPVLSGDTTASEPRFSIVLSTFAGDGHFAQATQYHQQACILLPDMANSMRVHPSSGGSVVVYGSYSGWKDPAAREDVKTLQQLTINDRQVFPQAMLSELNPLRAHDSIAEEELLSLRLRYPDIRVLYTLEIAMWGDFESGQWPERKRKAEAERYVRGLRQRGIPAFYHHDASREMSIVTVGVFDHRAVDGQTGLKSPQVERFLMDFPERRVNGEPVIDLYDPNDPGKGGRPQQPRIVEVPQL